MTPLASNIPSGFNPADTTSGAVPYGAQPPAIVTLTPEQSLAPLLEIRNHDNQLLGYLVTGPGVSLYFSPQQFEALQRRAAAPVPGKSLSEIKEIARKRVEG